MAGIHGTHVIDLGVAVDVGGRGEPITHSMRLVLNVNKSFDTVDGTSPPIFDIDRIKFT